MDSKNSGLTNLRTSACLGTLLFLGTPKGRALAAKMRDVGYVAGTTSVEIRVRTVSRRYVIGTSERPPSAASIT